MRAAERMAGMVVAMVLSACSVNVDFSGTQFRCDDSTKCPDGLPCVRNVCGGAPIDAAVDSPPIDPDAASDAAPPRCPSDCEPIDGDRLCVCPDGMAWLGAKELCAAAGFELARIASQADADLVSQAISDRGLGLTWLGGSDAAEEGTWKWVEGDIFWIGDQTGGPPNGAFANFGDGEPNNVGVEGEDCVGANATAWNDVPCETVLTFLCAARAP